MKPHGTYARYVGGCRCDDCRRANRTYHRADAVVRAAAYDRMQSRIYSAALAALRERHREEFDGILAEMWDATGEAS